MNFTQHLTINPLKTFLLLVSMLFALTTTILIFAYSSANSGGATPDLAVTLTDGANTGTLAPGEQHWFKFTPQGSNGQQPLNLLFTPNEGNTINFISLFVFEDNQIQNFANGDTMAVFGQGQIVTQDNDPNTGELFWTGAVSAPTIYYVQILNNSDFSIEYSLSTTEATLNVVPAVEPPAAPAETGLKAAVKAPLPSTTMKSSNAPDSAETLEPGLTKGRLAPNSTYWYTFTPEKSGSNLYKDLEYTMFFTPDDGHRKRNVNFKLYTYKEFEKWQRGDAGQMEHFGAGSVVDRDGDYNTGEMLWNGTVIKGDKYLIAITNGNDIPIDYYLFDNDIINPILGPLPEPTPFPVFAEGASPQTATPLRLGVNKGGLEPGEEAWYSFSLADFDNEFFEEMALTMVTTPDDGNRIRNMVFDVFTADAVKGWSPGDNSRIHNLGAGSVVYRDDNHLTGERFWSGWVVDNDLYYVQIRNGSDIHMDYHLFTGDVYHPELGEPTPAAAPKPAAPGTVPYAPLELAVDVNKGQLKPGEERWYTFTRGDGAVGGIIDTTFTMIFTPDDGNRIRSINLELFEERALREWAPDNRFNIIPFGRGSVVNRDGGTITGELLWKGQVLAGNKIFMRVSNDSDVTIDYSIFPEDVINANLD
jgi:hypothetical protein